MDGLGEIDIAQFRVMGSAQLRDNTAEIEEMWDKTVLIYYKNNLKHIRTEIKRIDSKLTDDKIDLVMAELGEALQKCRDYGECSEEENKLSLDKYVMKWANFCVRRLRHREAEEKKHRSVPVKISDESDEEHDAFEIIGDETANLKYRLSEINIDESLKQMQCKRNYYGIDLFELLYIRIKGLTMHFNREMTDMLTDICGMSQQEIEMAEALVLRDDDFNDLKQDIALTLSNSENTTGLIESIGKYVYARPSIDNVLNIMAKAK